MATNEGSEGIVSLILTDLHCLIFISVFKQDEATLSQIESIQKEVKTSKSG